MGIVLHLDFILGDAFYYKWKTPHSL